MPQGVYQPGDKVVATEDCGVFAGSVGVVVAIFWGGTEYDVKFEQRVCRCRENQLRPFVA